MGSLIQIIHKKLYLLRMLFMDLKQAPRVDDDNIKLLMSKALLKGLQITPVPTDSGFELTAFLSLIHADALILGKALWEEAELRGVTASCRLKTEYQLADMFTKALPEDRFKYLVRRIGMRCLTPAELEVLTNETA
ncbi:hypothetical protein Tco_0958883 [Tanacetum coccineum]